jgi:hypothetical protein
MVQVSTCQYMPVRTDLGITDVSTYCLVLISSCGFLYGLVSTSVRTASHGGPYQYIPSWQCTATLYQGHRIPDVRVSRAAGFSHGVRYARGSALAGGAVEAASLYRRPSGFARAHAGSVGDALTGGRRGLARFGFQVSGTRTTVMGRPAGPGQRSGRELPSCDNY